MKIQTTVENITQFPEDFGRKLAESLGWRTRQISDQWCYSYVSDFDYWLELKPIVFCLTTQSEAERAVIGKLGHWKWFCGMLDAFDMTMDDFESEVSHNATAFITASAPQRLRALLLALNITEIEVKENG